MRVTKILFVALSLHSLCFLTACEKTRRIDKLVPGCFGGYTERGNFSYRYFLRLNQISQSEYLEADGLNVIRDAVNGLHYSFSLTRLDGKHNVKTYVYSGFYDSTPGRHDLAVRYGTDQGAWFSPYTTTALDDPREPSQCGYYFVQPEKDGLESFSIYLHARNGGGNE